jgi:hypothetical protein
MKKSAINQLKGTYTAYRAIETHIEKAIELHNPENLDEMKLSEIHYEAGVLAQQIHMDKPELIEGYRQFCIDNGIEPFID